MSLSSLAAGTPCGACKFLRRKCVPDCVFAPYFCPDQGPERFSAIHRVFGASNVSKLLLRVPVHDRCDVVLTVEYEAQARLHDPVYGCVAHIQALQQQVTCLEAKLMLLKAQVAQNNTIQRNKELESDDQQWLTWDTNSSSLSMIPRFHGDHIESCHMNSGISPQSSSIESTTSIDHVDSYRNMGAGGSMVGERQGSSKRQRTSSSYFQYEWSELQELALRMMKD